MGHLGDEQIPEGDLHCVEACVGKSRDAPRSRRGVAVLRIGHIVAVAMPVRARACARTRNAVLTTTPTYVVRPCFDELIEDRIEVRHGPGWVCYLERESCGIHVHARARHTMAMSLVCTSVLSSLINQIGS